MRKQGTEFGPDLLLFGKTVHVQDQEKLFNLRPRPDRPSATVHLLHVHFICKHGIKWETIIKNPLYVKHHATCSHIFLMF